jgi:hypothetical protein
MAGLFADAIRSSGGHPDQRRQVLGLQRLEEKQKDSNIALSDIRNTLHRMEAPLSPKKFSLGGTVDQAQWAVVGDVPEFVNGELVTRPEKRVLPPGSQIVPLARQFSGITAIGGTETDFSQKEAYSNYYNTPERNSNVRKYGKRGADYGYYQMNEFDIEDAVRLGVDPDTARHLNGGGKEGTSSLAEQTQALNEYLKAKYPEAYERLAETGNFEEFRLATKRQWVGLGRHKGIPARKQYAEMRSALAPIGVDVDVNLDFVGLKLPDRRQSLKRVSISGPRNFSTVSTFQPKYGTWGG